MQRSYDIDWLRNIIVITIIPFHAFVIFDQNPEAIIYVKDKINVVAFNNIGGVIARFHMVTLFLLCGITIYYTLFICFIICELLKRTRYFGMLFGVKGKLFKTKIRSAKNITS